jgi:hypothetical protein
MARAPVICERSRRHSDISDLRSIEQATSRGGSPPLLETTKPCKLYTQEQDQPENKQLVGGSLYHRPIEIDSISCRSGDPLFQNLFQL